MSSYVAHRGLLLWYFWPSSPPAADAPKLDCETDYYNWQQLWTETHQKQCCELHGRGCVQQPHVIDEVVHVPVMQPAHNHYVPVPVPSPPHVVYKNHYVHLPPKVIYEHQEHHFAYDCHEGYSNWYFGWSAHKKSWCCDHRSMGCPGTWHGSYHLHTHVFAAGVGHTEGHIYDCGAGFSNWMQGWSDSKKDWCCHQQSRGCVKFHCTSGAAACLLWQSLPVGCQYWRLTVPDVLVAVLMSCTFDVDLIQLTAEGTHLGIGQS